MEEDRITRLLRQADRDAPAGPGTAADITNRIRQRYRRWRALSIGLSSGAATVLVIVGAVVLLSRDNSVRTASEPAKEIAARRAGPEQPVVRKSNVQEKMARLEAEVAQLRAEADARKKIIEDMLAFQQQYARLQELEQRITAIPDALEAIGEQRERAAFITAYQAGRKLDELNQKESAIRDYQELIRLFPETRSAEMARKKLNQIQNHNKGDLL